MSDMNRKRPARALSAYKIYTDCAGLHVELPKIARLQHSANFRHFDKNERSRLHLSAGEDVELAWGPQTNTPLPCVSASHFTDWNTEYR